MGSVITGLIVLAIAFPAGWLVCRAWLATQQQPLEKETSQTSNEDSISRSEHEALLKTQQEHYRHKVNAMHDLVRKHERTRDQIRDKLNRLQKRMDSDARAVRNAADETQKSEQNASSIKAALDIARRDLAAAKKQNTELEKAVAERTDSEAQAGGDIDLLKIERDELSAQVKRLEFSKRSRDKAKNKQVDEPTESLRADLGQAKEDLVARDHQIRQLENRLEERDARISELETTVNSWKHRVTPLAQQLKLQRNLIRRGQTEQRAKPTAPASAPSPAKPKDELQKIRGIGPTLERRLLANGISSFEQIAEMTPEELVQLAEQLSIANKLPARDAWGEQARRLHADKYLEPA